MKLLAALMLLLFWSVPLFASQEGRENTAFLAALTLDWAQTRTIATKTGWVNSDMYGSYYGYLHNESNPILGSHPSIGSVNAYFIASAATYLLVQEVLPDRWASVYRKSAIVFELSFVGSNLTEGIGFTF